MKQDLQQKRKELATLQTALSDINKEKEEAYHKLQEVRKGINLKSDSVKVFKKKRDELTVQVKSLKTARDTFNTAVKSQSGSNREAGEHRRKLTFNKEKESPSQLKSAIAKMEEKLETEVMAFTKEEQLRKSIKEIKKKLEKMSAARNELRKIEGASADFSESRRKAQESHVSVQEKAEESQKVHLEMNNLYKEIKAMRKDEKVVAKKYLEFKVKYQNVKIDIDALKKDMRAISGELEEISKKSFQSRVRLKTAEIQEKLKKGKKLSTEDILAFQAGD